MSNDTPARLNSRATDDRCIDARDGRCTCPDHEYRHVRCKHLRRVAFATGETALPAGVNRDVIDAQLGAHVTGSPRLAVTDGGEVLMGEERPEECECTGHEREALPCWYCYAEGFDVPNPHARE